MNKYKYIVPLVMLSVLLLSCGNKEAETTSTSLKVDQRIIISQSQFDLNNMQLGQLENNDFPMQIAVNGVVDVPPEHRAVVNATMGGYIKTTPLLVGDVVQKGQVLVTLENPEFVTLQQQYLEVNEQLSYLKSEYDRQVTMKAENITSQKNYLKAESDYKTALVKHTGLEKQLLMLHISPAIVKSGKLSSVVSIFSPISGTITNINVTKGSFVSPASEILEIINNEHIHLELSVFEKDIMQIKKGQQIDFKIPEASQDTYKALVHLVGTSIDANRTVRVHAHLVNHKNKDHNFLVGMFVEANIASKRLTLPSIPTSSIVTVNQKKYVLVLDEKKGDTYYFNKKEVLVKSNYNNFSSLNNGDEFTKNTQFLTKGAFNLIGE